MFRVQGLRAVDLTHKSSASPRVQGAGFRVAGGGFRVQFSGFNDQGSGFEGCGPHAEVEHHASLCVYRV